MVYLDNNATTTVRDEVRLAMMDALMLPGNPSSVHKAGREARAAMELARKHVAKLAGCDQGDVIFTSGATEANNLVLSGWPKQPKHFVSATEHDSVLDAVPDAVRLPVHPDGQLDLEKLDQLLSEQAEGGNPLLVSVMFANNETGIIQPIRKIRAITKDHGAFFHVDAVQAAGKLALDFSDLDLDAMSLSAHKIGGPKGVGCLILKEGLTLNAQMRGGGQEKRRRCGTENLSGIVGFGKAAEIAERERESEYGRLNGLRHLLENEIAALDLPVEILGRNSHRTPNVTNLILPGMPSETQVMTMDLAGVAVSAGSACSSGKVKLSHVLVAMGLDDARSGSSLRVSLGWNNNLEDIEVFVKAYAKMAARAVAR